MLALEISAAIIPFGDTHAVLQRALPWDGEELGQGMQQPGDGAAWLLSMEQAAGSGEKARALTGLLSLMEQMWQLLCATTAACLRSGQRTPRAVPRAGTWGLSFSSRALEEELIVPARN